MLPLEKSVPDCRRILGRTKKCCTIYSVRIPITKRFQCTCNWGDIIHSVQSIYTLHGGKNWPSASQNINITYILVAEGLKVTGKGEKAG